MKKIIIGLAIAVPLVGIYLYRKNKNKTRVRQNRTVNNRQQLYNMQQAQILRDKFIAGGILKESEIPN